MVIPPEEQNRQLIATHVREILRLIGEDPDREGLLETPKRVSRMYQEIFSGLRNGTEPKVTIFKNEESYNELVCETNIHFYSVCEHHLVPFFGVVHMGYIPKKKGYYVGLSKLARIVDFYASRPQVQERLTCQIANWINQKLKPEGCIVVMEAEHLCLSMRGIKKPKHKTITSAIRGDIDKREFFDILARVKTE
jgi:GTP cyclohydrolase IA